MLTLPATLADRVGREHAKRVYLVEIALAGGTLYLSYPMPWTNWAGGTAQQWYDDLIVSLSPLGQEISHLETTRNSAARITLRNHVPIKGYSRLIDLFDADPVDGKQVDIWEVFYDTVGHIDPVDAKTGAPHWTFFADQVESLTRQTLALPLSSIVYAYDDRMPLKKLTTADFSGADPDHVGRWRNDVYGASVRVPCLAIDAGPADKLREDLTAAATTLKFSDPVPFALFAAAATVQIDEEQILLGTKDTGNLQFTGCTRARNSTTAVAHDKGASIFKVQTEYKYEISTHACKAVSGILVDGVLAPTGEYHLDTASGHQLHFTVRPIIRKQVAITVAGEHGHSTAEGSHSHGTTSQTIYTKAGVSSSGGTAPENARDGSESTQCILNGETLSVTLESGTYGTLSKVVVTAIISHGPNRVGSHMYVRYNGVLVGTIEATSSTGINPSGYRFTYVTSTWATGLTFEAEYDADSAWGVWECGCEFHFAPTISAHAADGVSASVSGSTSLGGNSSADVVVGREVIAIVDGRADDGSGTYTGTPNALIERPDHVAKHLLKGQAGIAAGLVDAMSAAGTFYGTKSYKCSFILAQVGQRLSQVLTTVAHEARSNWVERQGKVGLIHWPDSAPGSADLVLDETSGIPWMRDPDYAKTPLQRVRNEVYVHYKRVYSLSGAVGGGQGAPAPGAPAWRSDPGAEYSDVTKVTNAASQTKYGARLEEITLRCVADATHAADWAAWLVSQIKDVMRTIQVGARWDARALEVGDYIQLSGPFWPTVMWRVTKSQVDPASGFQQISGIELVVP